VLIRPYSIASDPEDAARVELLLNRVPGGPGSGHLFGLVPGATLRFTGPWGTFTLDRAPAAPAVFVADGTGIAPIRPMLRRALATGGGQPVELLYASPLVYQTELDALAARAPRFTWHRGASATLVAEVTRRWVDADADRSRCFFICGVGAVVRTLRDLLRGAGYERRAVQYEVW
jgi:ferredoxin-NADP reductase